MEKEEMIRKRFTISEDELRAAEEYAALDHRTLSELICEALKQMRYRYPHKDGHAIRTLKGLEKRLYRTEQKFDFIREKLEMVLGDDPRDSVPAQVHAGTLEEKRIGSQ